jgi:hypothetical protein
MDSFVHHKITFGSTRITSAVWCAPRSCFQNMFQSMACGIRDHGVLIEKEKKSIHRHTVWTKDHAKAKLLWTATFLRERGTAIGESLQRLCVFFLSRGIVHGCSRVWIIFIQDFFTSVISADSLSKSTLNFYACRYSGGLCSSSSSCKRLSMAS